PVAVVIRRRAAALFTVNLDSAAGSIDCIEMTVACAQQKQAASGIATGGLRLDIKKILAEKNILAPIAIKIGNVDAKGRRKLSLRRQRDWVEMIAAIEKDCCFHPIRFKHLRLEEAVAQSLFDGRLGKAAVAAKCFAYERHGMADRAQIM